MNGTATSNRNRNRKRAHRWGNLLLCVWLGACVFFPQSAYALQQSGELSGVRYRVMAPEWVCQDEMVNLLVVVSAAVGRDVELVAELTPPTTGFLQTPDTPNAQRLTVAAGSTRRFAFTGYRAATAAGEHTFLLTLRFPLEPGSQITIPFNVRAIRGAAVPRGLWSIVVPAAIAVLALPVFVCFLSRAAKKGAWRSATEAEISTPTAKENESWWTEKSED